MCDTTTPELWGHTLDGARLVLEATMAAVVRDRDFWGHRNIISGPVKKGLWVKELARRLEFNPWNQQEGKGET